MSRLLIFAYGVLSYLVFLATFLYAVAFIGNFSVPTRLDGPAVGSFGSALGVNLGLLSLFAVQHSLMARKWFKDAWTQIVPAAAERSTYVLFSSLALILLFWLWRPMGGVIWSVESPLGRYLAYGLFASGWALLLFCTFLINHFDLFGLRQVWLNLRGRPYTGLSFVTPGPYQVVRHPLYVGWLIAFWATPTMTIARLVFSLATTAYILIAIQFEEHDLVREHGASYEQYRSHVPMLLPLGGRSRQDAVKRAVVAR